MEPAAQEIPRDQTLSLVYRDMLLCAGVRLLGAIRVGPVSFGALSQALPGSWRGGKPDNRSLASGIFWRLRAYGQADHYVIANLQLVRVRSPWLAVAEWIKMEQVSESHHRQWHYRAAVQQPVGVSFL